MIEYEFYLKIFASVWAMSVIFVPIYYYLEIKLPLKADLAKRSVKSISRDISWEILASASDYVVYPARALLYGFLWSFYWDFFVPRISHWKILSGYLEKISLPVINVQNFLIQFVIVFLLRDLLIYFIHRRFHRGKMWGFHILHHSSSRMDIFINFRNHFLDAFLSNQIIDIVMIMFKVDPMIALVIQVISCHSNFIIHANIKLPNFLGMNKLFNSPLAHHWHHSDEQIYKGGQNFGGVLIIWDKMFGTFYIDPEGQPPVIYGIKDQMYPKTFMEQLIYPFVYLKSKLSWG